MKHLSICKVYVVLVSGLLFSCLGFSQTIPEDCEGYHPTYFTYYDNFPNTESFDALLPLGQKLLESEPLIARKQTIWAVDPTGDTDSTTYLYNEAGQIIKQIERVKLANQWLLSTQTIFSYNDNGELERELFQAWSISQGAWFSAYRLIYQYDTHDAPSSIISQNWANENWENRSKTFYKYDENGNTLSRDVQFWENNEWQPTSYTEATYNSSNKIRTWKRQRKKEGVLQNNLNVMNTYDEQGNLIEVLRQVWEADNWRNSEWEQYTYNDNGNRVSRLKQVWEDDIWVNDFRETYEHAISSVIGDYVVNYLMEIWQDDGTWRKLSQLIRTYDESELSMLSIMQLWNHSTWSNSRKIVEKFTENGSSIYFSEAYWENDEWYQYNEENCYYDKDDMISGLTELPDASFNVSIYPNPSNGQLSINMLDKQWETGHVKLFNAMGQLVYTQSFPNGMQQAFIQVDGLLEGTYILQIETPTQQATRKVMITRN